MIGVIDYGLGNLARVTNVLESLGEQCVVSSNLSVLQKADGYILPGVGAAGEGMKNLRQKGLNIFVKQEIAKGKSLLGICLGMQLLFEKSEEGNVGCLDILSGKVKKLQTSFKIPQIGWNQIMINKKNLGIMKNVQENIYVYFVNSYVCVPLENAIITATTEYGQMFCSAVQKGNVYGTQFHPEKSGMVGTQIIKNFISIVEQKL